MSTESLRSGRDHLSEVVDRVEHQRERVIVTRNGHVAAVLISPEDLAQLEETIDVLSDPRLWPTFAKQTPPTHELMWSAVSMPFAASVAAAVIDLLTTRLVTDPHRMGKPLHNDLEGIWSARRGTYRVLYRIRDDTHEVIVLGVEHRRGAYRPM